MDKTCKNCSQHFEVSDEDMKFYERVSPFIKGTTYLIPPPTFCPLCRQQRRMSWRNERKLYNRKCDFSGRPIVSIYSADKPYKVYESKVWWSDDFDGKKYARDFDFLRPFFEQLRELQLVVPRLALFGKKGENSEYTNHADQLKNCYLVMNGGNSENCFYANWVVNCRDCMDSSYVDGCELCYECTYCNTCYNCQFAYHCDDCRDSRFVYDCKGVSKSVLCVGLRNKSYCILNEQYSKEEFEKKIKEFSTASYTELQILQKSFQELLLKHPHRALFLNNSENCSGQNIFNSKNCQQCFFLYDSQDCKYCYNSAVNITDSYDIYETGINCELQIETHACNRSKYIGFSNASYDNNNIWYSDNCHNSSYLFGCIGLKKDQYCILNKQYSREEYERLVPTIIEHMKKSNEYGEFFPTSMSPFAYNETVAHDAISMTKEQVEAKNWHWYEDALGGDYQGEKARIPDTIEDVEDDILEKILTCETCQKHYRIIRQELNFYRQQKITLPRQCVDCRHRARTKNHYQFTLFPRNCAKCNFGIQTTYASDQPETVYCEKCYLETVY